MHLLVRHNTKSNLNIIKVTLPSLTENKNAIDITEQAVCGSSF